MNNNNKIDLLGYEYYVNLLTTEINKMFEHQKEFICCKNGCSLCCEDGMYPFSKIEFEFLIEAYEKLDENIKNKIKDEVVQLSTKINQEEFLYKCPFLINKSCSVYYNRGLICRTFGLISENESGKLTIPYCARKGLNYSKVYNEDTHRISEEKVKELNYKTLPKAYNLSRNNLMYGITDKLNFNWGETKPLIIWLIDYFNL